MPDEAKSAKDLFLAAVELASLAERHHFLEQACADNAALRHRVQALLNAHDASGDLIDKPAVAGEPTGAYHPISEGPGSIIGPYKLLQKIGEGGFGVVFMAEQTQPVRRMVALKIIKPGMDTAQVIARFESERQALAIMDHPNIAKVLDAGTTAFSIDDCRFSIEEGSSHEEQSKIANQKSKIHCRPYFVMELVKGVPITEFCDKNHLPPEARLKLFIDVCHAIQHAHHKGIIHRDIKPSNVMVTLHDGVPVVKVIDFGVAKATVQKLTEKTLFTAYGQMIGTPAYMSPEQAEMSGLDIDTRSDVYSLGVLLYELLTGTTPLEGKRLREAGYVEMQRLIREEEAPRPSNRLSSLMASRVASAPGAAPGVTAEILAGNRGLDVKRLVQLLAGDLDWVVMKALEKDRNRRYVTPGSFAEDIERYLHREAILARPPSTAYKLKKFAQRNRAAVLTATAILFVLLAGIAGTTFGLIRAEHRRAEAEQAQANEAEQRRKAEQAETETLAAYQASTDDAIEQLIGSKPELGPKEKAYLENTLKRWQEFAKREGNDERSQAIRAEGHARVAKLWAKLGQRDAAHPEYETARDLFKKLAAAFPAVPEYQHNLARTHGNLGNLLADLGERDAARTEYETARDLQKKLAAAFPAVPQYQQELASTHNNLGFLLADLGERDAARTEYETARDLQKKLAAAFPAVPLYQQNLAGTHNNLGNLLADLGQRDAARTEYETARDLQKKLAAAFATLPQYQQELAHTYNNLGILLANLGQRDAARTEYETARELQKKLAATFPAVPEYQQDLARTRNNLGSLLAGLGERDAARTEYETARDLQKRLVVAFPAVPLYQVQLGVSYYNFGNLVRSEGKPADSLPWFDLAILTLTPVHEKEPRDVTAKQFLRNSYGNRAFAHDQLKKHVEAVKDWGRAIELSQPAEQPGLRASRANSRVQAGQVAEAVAEVAALTTPGADAPGSVKWTAAKWYDFACVYAVASGRIADKKQEYAGRAMELLHKAVNAGYKDATHMAKDKDLDALRGREDFKKLLGELDAGPTKN